MKRRTIFSLAIVFGLFLVLASPSGQAYGYPSLAPIDTSFTYQGKLVSGGIPANGAYDFTFALYDAPNGGAQVGGTVTRNGVTVTDGLFTVQLDFGAVFDGTALYLEIGVRPGSGGAYTTLLPRQALTAAPYARYAAQSPWSGLVGVPPGFADGTDDSSTYTPGAGLFLDTTEFSILGSFQLPQGCNPGQLPQWNGSAWICTNDSNSGGDITGVTAGTGLTGGGGSGIVTLGLVPSYQLPQTCANGQLPQGNGNGRVWVCANDSGATYTAGTGLALSSSGQFDLVASYRLPQGCANEQIPQWNGSSAWVCADDSGSTSDYIRAGGPAGGDLTGTYPNPQIAANAVGSAEIADNSVDMADTVNWMRSDLESDYFGSADTRGYIYLYGPSFTPSADGSCMVIANAWIRSSSGGSASSGGSPTLGTFMNFIGDSYNRPDPTVPVPFSPGDVDDEQPITASATWVWAVTGGRATRFGCFVSDPDGIAGTDWGSDEYVSCRISYICQ